MHFLQNPNITTGQDKDAKLVICIFIAYAV